MARKNPKMSKKDFDDQFEAFLKESMSSEDSINSARISKYLEPKRKEKQPWWMQDDDDDEEEIGTGLTASGKSFLKKKKPPEPENSTPIRDDKTTSIRDTKPETGTPETPDLKKGASKGGQKTKAKRDSRGARGKGDVSMSKDSLEDSKTGGPGFETLDELAEKDKFFREMERNADGTIDYGQLNKDLSQSATTMSPEGAAKTAATLAALEDIEEDESLKPEPKSHQRSVSEDPSQQKPSMLSKVSLMDSMESTMNTSTVGAGGSLRNTNDKLDDIDGPQHVHQSMPGSFKTGTGGTGFMGTNTSQEIEALHKALREVGLSPTLKNDSQPFDSSTAGNNSELLQKILAGEPEKGKQRPFEELLKEMEQGERRAQGRYMEDRDVQLLSEMRKSPITPRGVERQPNVDDIEEMRGFGLSPIHQSEMSHPIGHDHSHTEISQPGGFDHSHTEDTEMYQPVTQVSIQERGRPKKKEGKEKKEKSKHKRQKSASKDSPGRSLSPRSSPQRKSLDRSRSLSPTKPGLTLLLKGQRGSKKNHLAKPGSARERAEKQREKPRERSKEKYKDRKGAEQKSDKPHRERPVQHGQTWSPVDVSKQKIQESPTIHKSRDLGMESQLRASVDSFASYIREHFTSEKDVPQVKYSVDEPSLAASWKGERSLGQDDLLEKREKYTAEQVNDETDAVKREYERKLEAQKLEYEELIHKLKQENYVLAAKVPDADGEFKKQMMNGDMDGLSKEQAEKLQKELREQETLIGGYQQENKRLYDQLKNIQKQSKQTEERMFNENQKLIIEISNLRTQLESRVSDVSSKGMKTVVIDHHTMSADDNRHAQLKSELRETKMKDNNLQLELQVLQRQKFELSKKIDQLLKENEQLSKSLEDLKAEKLQVAKEIEAKFGFETEKLNKKLKWYAENQKLLDKDTKRLKEKDDEIHRLKMKLEDFQSETGRKVEENKLRSRERAADAKKIQDLQRQVKEMEQIMKRRHPNSLPSLMMTAAVVPDEGSTTKTPYIIVLENKVKKLEVELASKDQDEEKMLRSVEQKYLSVKIQFEDRIKDLETQLAIYRRSDDNSLKDYDHPHTHAVALQREMDTMRDKYKKQVADLQGQVNSLTSELTKVKNTQEVAMKNEVRASKEMETDLSNRVKLLQIELESKNHDIQVLHKSLERLRKEKQLGIVNGWTSEKKKKKSKTRTVGEEDDRSEENEEGERSSEDKEKQDRQTAAKMAKLLQENEHLKAKVRQTKGIIDRQTAAKMVKLLQENEHLKAKLEELYLELEHNKLEIRKSEAEFQSYFRKSQEHYEEKVEALCSSHQKELQKILSEQALEHSASKMAQLQSKVNAQEVMIDHLKSQLNKTEVELEQVSVLKIQNESKQCHIEKLQEELKEAKKFHTPEMKHLEAIQDKILSMEKRHEQRELELQKLVQSTKDNASVEIDQQTKKWKQIIEMKNNEIKKFRSELDSILDVLRLLQKQGVVLPVRTSLVSS
ncbi:hypothetical protein FSP39_021588 [Pinctada imbricata]|uniref:Centrosomal protein of 162 kDa n=1 Tax=Pinctada imbricata TaxID=66713 RepID=A0AA88Y333_PINIB|nr:hypothetical protein FSP39_021588 [Pinctada imbricata]